MKLIKSSYYILSDVDEDRILKSIEIAGRTCYKSEDKITPSSSKKFVKMIVKRGHLSVIEHESLSIRFIFDRGISHEMVRHRLSSFSQESSRYVNYSKDKSDNQISVIDISKHLKNASSFDIWVEAMVNAEKSYLAMIENGEKPEIARSVLPNSTKTEIVVTANLRQWRLIFTQRTAKVAHPQIREVMRPLLNDLKFLIPIIFEDITYE